MKRLLLATLLYAVGQGAALWIDIPVVWAIITIASVALFVRLAYQVGTSDPNE